LSSEHWCELRLSGGAFEEPATQEAHTYADTKCTKSDQQRDGEHIHPNNEFHQNLQLINQSEKQGRCQSVTCVMRLTQINNRQHHEYEGLQRNHKYVEYGPAEMQRQLPETDKRNQNKNQFASVHVAEQPQRQ
jgi:hypothetical protein